MSAEQAAAELTTRDVLQQVDRRLSLIEGDLRSLDEKLDDRIEGVYAKIGALDAKFDVKFSTLDAKFDTLHLGTTQDILSVRQEIQAVRQEIRELELRLTVRLGGMMVVGITVVATLVKLL